MEFTAKQIAELVEGTVVGNPEAKVNSVSKIEEGKPGSISFLSNPKYTKFVYETKASVVLVNNTFIPEHEISATLIKVENAYVSVAKLMQMYQDMQPKKSGIEQPSFVSESASLGDFVYLGAFAYVGENVKIGDNVKIYPNTYVGDNVTIDDNTILYAGVKIYEGCRIGKNCILHAGAVVGADGFGFAPDENNKYNKIPQIGNVVIEDDCELGANTAIDRATMGSTILRRGVKLDNFVQIAHNVEVGENTVIAAISGIAGSTTIGKNCMFGGHVGVIGHSKIADGVKLGAFTGVGNSVEEEGLAMRGAPAMPIGNFNKSYVLYRKLPELAKQIRDLQNEIKKLKDE